MKKRAVSKFRYIFPVVLILHIGSYLYAFPRSMILQSIKGPWELSIGLMGQDSDTVFPLQVEDENVRQQLDKIFPVLGTPLQVRVIEYCPDLGWEMVVAEDPQGGPLASVTIAGKGAQQDVVLLARVPEKRAVTASIGGLAIREVYHASEVETLLRQMAKEKAMGILTFWTDPNAIPQEFVVETGDTFKIPGTSYSAEVLAYMPHYSIDRETKEVKNYSEQPVNPALKVRLSDGQDTYEQWVWSNFSTSPHAMSKFPIRIAFNDFDFGPSHNRYFIVTAQDNGWWLYYQASRKPQIEKGQFNHPYAFNDSEYTFSIDSILERGSLNKKWVNRSEKLDHPALVVSVESDKGTHEAVVELNSPTPVSTAYGTLVLNYRQKAEAGQHGTP